MRLRPLPPAVARLHDLSRLMAQMAKVSGLVAKSQSCERCGGSDSLDGHHADYAKPFDVEWLCHWHHLAADAELRARLTSEKATSYVDRVGRGLFEAHRLLRRHLCDRLVQDIQSGAMKSGRRSVMVAVRSITDLDGYRRRVWKLWRTSFQRDRKAA
jgi:hypothetical protein